MNPATILSTSVLLASALASEAHPNVRAVADLIARAMDPVTMDPTKLSVLSVLKTAMPTPTGTGTDIVLPTGDAAPQWYKDLPVDVMVLLAQMYPATSTEATGAETASVSASQTTPTGTLELVPTATAASNGSLSTGSASDAPVNATHPTASPSPTQSAISTGAKNTVDMAKWSAAMGLGVAAVFCFFA